MGVSLQPLTMAHFGTLCVLLLGCMAHSQAARSSNSRALEHHSKLSLLKETSNKIERGPEYVSHHKGDRQEVVGHKGATKHGWKHSNRVGYTKKSKQGMHGSQQAANTRYDHDNIHLQRLDHQPITSKNKMPKNLKQMMKRKSQKPNKKMDKMYKKMIEKERLRMKKKYFKKMQKTKKHVVP